MFNTKRHIPFLKKTNLQLINKINETADIFTFDFHPTKKLDWIPGQHGVFFLNTSNKIVAQQMRVFSIASIPQEMSIKISVKISDDPSEFKQALSEMQIGEIISMRGPIGSFSANFEGPTILIAGGIGITPYRSIIQSFQLLEGENNQPIYLYYLESQENYIYLNEWKQFINHKNIKIFYFKERSSFYRKVEEISIQYKNDATYYIAGPKSLTKSMSKFLKEKGISKRQLKKDSFFGY